MGSYCAGGDKDKKMPEDLKDKEPETIPKPKPEPEREPEPEPEPVPVPVPVPAEPEPEPEPAMPVPTTPEQLHRAAHPGPIFATTLENAAQRSDPAGLVPMPVRHCCEWLRKYGLKEEGLFRIPGARAKRNAMIKEYDADPCMELQADEYVHNVGSLIVVFIMTMEPDKLWGVSQEEQNEFQLAVRKLSKSKSKGSASIVRSMKVALWKLPATNRATLKEICGMLHEACKPENAVTNKMDPKKFAMCVAPAIQMGMALMIEHYVELFKE